MSLRVKKAISLPIGATKWTLGQSWPPASRGGRFGLVGRDCLCIGACYGRDCGLVIPSWLASFGAELSRTELSWNGANLPTKSLSQASVTEASIAHVVPEGSRKSLHFASQVWKLQEQGTKSAVPWSLCQSIHILHATGQRGGFPSLMELQVQHDDLSILTCFNNVVITYHQASCVVGHKDLPSGLPLHRVSMRFRWCVWHSCAISPYKWILDRRLMGTWARHHVQNEEGARFRSARFEPCFA